ncbi:MAG: peptidoglycan-binding protein [Microcoleaceae cyanobacterium]
MKFEDIIRQNQVISLETLKRDPELVRQLQLLLSKLSLYPSAQVDGRYSPQTQKALEKFTWSQYLDTVKTGKIGKTFAERLLQKADPDRYFANLPEPCKKINDNDNNPNPPSLTLNPATQRILLKDAPGCSTSVLDGLSRQLIDEMNWVEPNSLVSFANLNVDNGSAVYPFLQPAARTALSRVITARGRKMLVNSAYRTIAQQQMLYNQGQEGRCGIGVVATPGRSNHQSGLAIDIEDYYGWRPFLESQGWLWLGEYDPPHFDYVGWGTRDIRWLAILAFQQLWNRNNPRDQVYEDGLFGWSSEYRLNRSPINGFPPRVLYLTLPYMEGGDVQRLQLALVKAGTKVGTDGVFGPGTELAVMNFQRQKGLVADGVVGPNTFKTLGLS